MQGGAGGNTSLMPGDWICDVCENNNFARRRECRRCGTPRSQTSTTIDERSQGQWVPRGGQRASAPALTPLALPPGAAAPPGGRRIERRCRARAFFLALAGAARVWVTAEAAGMPAVFGGAGQNPGTILAA